MSIHRDSGLGNGHPNNMSSVDLQNVSSYLNDPDRNVAALGRQSAPLKIIKIEKNVDDIDIVTYL